MKARFDFMSRVKILKFVDEYLKISIIKLFIYKKLNKDFRINRVSPNQTHIGH